MRDERWARGWRLVGCKSDALAENGRETVVIAANNVELAAEVTILSRNDFG